MERISITINRELKNQIEALAERKHRSVSQQVCYMIQSQLDLPEFMGGCNTTKAQFLQEQIKKGVIR